MSVNGCVLRIKCPNNNEDLYIKLHVEPRIKASSTIKMYMFYWNIPKYVL